MSKSDLHKAIRDAHCTDNQDVQQERDDDDALVEADQTIVLAQAVLHQIRIHNANKVPIKVSIKEKKQHLLGAIPNSVDSDPAAFISGRNHETRIESIPWAYLQSRWYPDNEDADIDQGHIDGGTYDEAPAFDPVPKDDTNAIDNNLR